MELERQLIRTGRAEAREIAEKLRDVDIQFHSTLRDDGEQDLMDFQYLLRHLCSLHAPRAKRIFIRIRSLPMWGFQPAGNGTADAFHGDAPAPENAV